MPFSDSNGALDHFSTHMWVKLQETNKKSEDLLNYLIMSLPLDKWLEHQGLSKDHGDGRSFMKEMKKRAQDVIRYFFYLISLLMKRILDYFYMISQIPVKIENYDYHTILPFCAVAIFCKKSWYTLRKNTSLIFFQEMESHFF